MKVHEVHDRNEQSVTRWLNDLRDGDASAASKLWERFFTRMKGVAHTRLAQQVKAASDEEDMAISAYNVFVQSLQGGKYPDLDNREDLWRLLVTITIRKANRARDKAKTEKRGGGGALLPYEDEMTAASEPSPAALAMVTDECRYLLGLLKSDELEMVAVGKLEGLTNDEIAAQLGSTKRTVQRMTALIRGLWEEEAKQIIIRDT